MARHRVGKDLAPVGILLDDRELIERPRSAEQGNRRQRRRAPMRKLAAGARPSRLNGVAQRQRGADEKHPEPGAQRCARRRRGRRRQVAACAPASHHSATRSEAAATAIAACTMRRCGRNGPRAERGPAEARASWPPPPRRSTTPAGRKRGGWARCVTNASPKHAKNPAAHRQQARGREHATFRHAADCVAIPEAGSSSSPRDGPAGPGAPPTSGSLFP